MPGVKTGPAGTSRTGLVGPAERSVQNAAACERRDVRPISQMKALTPERAARRAREDRIFRRHK